MITDLGSGTLAVAIPGAASSAAAAVTIGGIAAPNVSAQLTALASFTPQAVLPFADQIAALQATIAALQAAIAAGLSPPSLAAQAALAASAAAMLSANLSTISAQLSLVATLQGFLAAAGVRVLVYSGPQNDFGSELSAALGVDATNCNAVVQLTQIGATWTAMQGVLKTS